MKRTSSAGRNNRISFVLLSLYHDHLHYSSPRSTFIMHNALAVLYSVLFLFGTWTSALFIPQFRLAPSKSTDPELANKCSFTLWHKQIHMSSTKYNFIQLNEIQDHANGMVIDIAALRTTTARNSYNAISNKIVFAVEGLLDNTNLTIRGEDGKNEVVCEHDGVFFSSDERKNSRDVWCVSEAWNNVIESGVGSRVRILKQYNVWMTLLTMFSGTQDTVRIPL
jgi:hypothetical protein